MALGDLDLLAPARTTMRQVRGRRISMVMQDQILAQRR
jgi:ABC-type microcin C transport system duplicated ATPase subunit YejF